MQTEQLQQKIETTNKKLDKAIRVFLIVGLVLAILGGYHAYVVNL